jgi:hypothetical protein
MISRGRPWAAARVGASRTVEAWPSSMRRWIATSTVRGLLPAWHQEPGVQRHAAVIPQLLK